MMCLICDCVAMDKIDKKEEKPVYKKKIKTFNPRFIALEKNKKTIREAALWAFIPCGGFIYLEEYSYLALFGSYMFGMGVAFGFCAYRWWDMSKHGRGVEVESYFYWTGGLFFLGYVLSIIVSIISAKMKNFDETDEISIVVKPSEIGKSGGFDVKFNIDTKTF